MKKIILAGASIVALTAATPAFAQSTSTVTQTGDGNVADVSQTGDQTSTIEQDGDNQEATVDQSGSGNDSSILQDATGENVAFVTQDGTDSEADITQTLTSDSSTATINQASDADGNLAIVFQVQLRGSIKFMREFSSAGFAQYLELIRKTFEQGQKEKLFRKDLNPVICSKIFFGSLDEMVTNWILSKKKYELPPLADEVMKVFLGGVMVKT